MANITATYPQGASTTKVSPGVASPMNPDMTARLQLDALIGQERQTGYRSVKPMYLPMPTQRDYSTPQNHAAPTYAPHGMGVAPPPHVAIPEKWYTVMDYAGNVTRVINPEYERWAASVGQFDVGPDTTQFAGGVGGGQLPQEAGGVMPKQPTAGSDWTDSWYDMPEWQRTQILANQLYASAPAPLSPQTPQSPKTPTQPAMASPPAPPYWLARP